MRVVSTIHHAWVGTVAPRDRRAPEVHEAGYSGIPR